MKKHTVIALLIASVFVFGSCSDPKTATRALENQGFSDIKIGGYGWFACSDNDAFATNFEAKNPINNRIVTGTVCNGWLKNSTIRFD